MSYSEDVDDAHENDDDASGDDDAPECQADGFLARVFLVQVGEDAVAKSKHGDSEHDEARLVAEEGPILCKMIFEEREFGDDEEDCSMGQ